MRSGISVVHSPLMSLTLLLSYPLLSYSNKKMSGFLLCVTLSAPMVRSSPLTHGVYYPLF